MNKFNDNGQQLRDQIKSAVDNFKITYTPIKNKNITKLEGGCFIKDENTGNPTINMTKVDDNMHTEESCKLNAAIKQHNYLKQQIQNNTRVNNIQQNDNAVYYSLVENNTLSTTNGYYDCYVSDVIPKTIEQSDNFKEVTIWKAFSENETESINPGNYAYYRNGALFICNSSGKVLKQLGNTIDENAYSEPNSYYILKDNEKSCYGSRYTDIQ
ncbi:hypothetical protein OAS95_02195 [Pelagibacteraceae bacterium]|nr:hypothetical protein [Pelagibacteraceae bacterium]